LIPSDLNHEGVHLENTQQRWLVECTRETENLLEVAKLNYAEYCRRDPKENI